MLIRLFAAAALATGSVAAQAGTLQNGVYTVSCTTPGDPPVFSSKSPDAYNKAGKEAQVWQDAVKAYQTCLQTEVKADQQILIDTANKAIQALSDQITALNAQSQDAMAKLKKASGQK
jgi:hypothetical protein